MRTIERTSQFKRDYRRVAKGRHRETIDNDLATVVSSLVNDQPLAPNHRDHSLVGDWKDYRDCHVKPDLILIFRKTDNGALCLARIRSHSKLSL